LIAELVRGTWKIIGIGAACATLPGTIELLTLSLASLFPKKQRTAHTSSTGWRVAVIVPAHNEAANIESCVQSLLDADRGTLQVGIYVIADNCTDNTALVAEKAGAKVLPRTHETERGKGYALHFAFTRPELQHYDGILVVDADTAVTKNFIVAAGGTLRDGADAVQVRYLVRNLDEGVRTRLMGLALRAFNVVRPLGRDRFGLSVGILGNGFGMRSETLKAVPYLASSVVEDLEYHLKLVQAGYRVEFVNDTTVFGEMPARGEGVKTQRSRWEGGRLRMVLERCPELLRGLLAGRLIFLEPLLDLLLLPLAFHVTLLAIAISAPQVAARNIGLLGVGVVILHLVAAALVGGGSWLDIGTLAIAPFYILWKLTMIPSLLRNARSNNTWVRTRRNAEAETADPTSRGRVRGIEEHD
jgi:cellulose synthase/poly-beta-1,6-N-acetylglucosamine synthase-like glycosyltransferase